MTCAKGLGLVVALGCSACVLGQGPGEALNERNPHSQEPETAGRGAGAGAQMGAAGRAGDGRSGGASAGATGATTAGTMAAGAGGSGARGGSTSTDAGHAGGTTDRDAAMATDSSTGDDTGSECGPLEVEGCNPVTNEGCAAELSMQCAIDPLATLTGYCIFFSSQPPTGTACFNSGVTESCPPTFTCLDGECRELCFCDADCKAGQCCVEPLEGTGFKACGDC